MSKRPLMNDKKIEVNLVYAPATRPQHKVFANKVGSVWHSKVYDPNKINIGMGWYSIRDPKPQDSILVVEPYCVLQRDYDVGFIKKFKHIFTWATNAMTHGSVAGKVVPINHPTYHQIPNLKKCSENWLPWDKRSDEIVIIANNKSSKHHSELYSLRIYLADVLDAFSPYKVSWYGQMPLKRPYYRGVAKNKQEVLGRVKFSICTENSYDQKYTHNYFTEKMPDVWAAGAVPIYMGCYNIDDMGKLGGCYIDLRPLVQKHKQSWRVNKKILNDKIVNVDEAQYKTYIERLHTNIDQTGLLQQHHSYKRVYEKMILTFHRELLRKK
ncbi:MAG: hypothetical protein ACXADB_02420 [Candidatus Hermodarchaeia archaeon]